MKDNVVSLINMNTLGQMHLPNILDTGIQDTGLVHLYWKRRRNILEKGELTREPSIEFYGGVLPTILHVRLLEAIGKIQFQKRGRISLPS